MRRDAYAAHNARQRRAYGGRVVPRIAQAQTPVTLPYRACAATAYAPHSPTHCITANIGTAAARAAAGQHGGGQQETRLPAPRAVHHARPTTRVVHAREPAFGCTFSPSSARRARSTIRVDTTRTRRRAPLSGHTIRSACKSLVRRSRHSTSPPRRPPHRRHRAGSRLSSGSSWHTAPSRRC